MSGRSSLEVTTVAEELEPARSSRKLGIGGDGPDESPPSSRQRLLPLLLCGMAAVVALFTVEENPVRFVFPNRAAAVVHDRGIAPVEDDVPWTRMRWRPAGGADNCPSGQRLANATIHCGVGESIPLEEKGDGSRYCGGLKMEPNYCILPKRGTWEPPSRTEGSAPPLPRRFGIGASNDESASSLPHCATMEDVEDGAWEGPAFDQEWVPNTCRALPLSPFAWTERAGCQTTVAMMGDSHIRNLFTATVHGLRGEEFFAEAHSTAEQKGRGVAETYEWRWNRNGSASDRVAIHRDTMENGIDFHDRCTCEDKVKRCLRIVFIWAPSFGDQMSQIPYVRKWRSDVVIVEPGNAYERADALSQNWTAALDNLLRESGGAELGMLHWAWGVQPKGRAEAIQRWIANGTVSPRRKSYLSQSVLSSPNGTGLQGRSTFHFACGLGQEEVHNDRIAAAEPCTDLTDTAQLRALITVHFGALLNRG